MGRQVMSSSIALLDSYPFAELADERTQSWPLVASPWHAALLLALYLLLLHFAPKWMARWVAVCRQMPSYSLSFMLAFLSVCSRKAFQLRLPLFGYNLFMALLNGYICLQLYTTSRALNYSVQCQPCQVSYDPLEIRVSRR